ncbi:hypothetical protein [Marinicella sp. W31]|uniref:hypothetical protein n=1 Tax=Marinicella sp. W31 TaxID=3023713 RepID=UPI003758397D
MRFLFPFNPLNEKEADGPFQDEWVTLQDRGVACSLFDYDVLGFNEFKPKPPLKAGETAVYRGWLMASGRVG